MTLTLLLDLDETLLSNNMDTFVPVYLKALSQHMTAYVDPGLLVKVLMAATNEMIKNLDPSRTLMEAFDAAFYPVLGREKSNLIPALDAFYSEKFPALQSLTQPKPDAQGLVMDALSNHDRVGIATNPLFPLAAVNHRLSWAGLSPDELPFSLVPSYSTFHFSKPEPAYFAEFLAQMGWPEGPVLVVGDDPELDILPARRLGLPVYWVTEGAFHPWPGDGPEPPHGSLGELRHWLAQKQSVELQPDYSQPDALLAILRSTPAALRTLLLQLDEETWYFQPDAETWSLVQICCHLRDVEKEINIPRIERIIEEVNPFVEGVDSDLWSSTRGYQEQVGLQALDDFVKSRITLLALLATLPPETWQRTARHAIFGPTNLQEIVKIITDHDRMHVRDVFRLVNMHR